MTEKLPVKIFIDGGDLLETEEAVKCLGFIDGQTTNPSLIAKNPDVAARLLRGEKFTTEEIWSFYKDIALKLASLVSWSVSVEVYADRNSQAGELIESARKIAKWSSKVWVKLPVTKAGLEAAKSLSQEGVNLNMTLCFSQAQAAAVYAATKGAKAGVFVSPFVGRLDDRGEKGMDLIKNILKMYEGGDGHVQVLTASVRTYEHLLYALFLKSPVITLPYKVFREWATGGFEAPKEDYTYKPEGLKAVVYKDLDLNRKWTDFNIEHELTDTGLEKFASDWKSLLK